MVNNGDEMVVHQPKKDPEGPQSSEGTISTIESSSSDTSSSSQTTPGATPFKQEETDESPPKLSPPSLCCSLPLSRDLQSIIDTFPKTEAAVVAAAAASVMVDKKKSPRKLPCLYCERTFVADNLRAKHVERSHSIKQARRSSSRFHQQQNTLPSAAPVPVSCQFCTEFAPTDSGRNLHELFGHLVHDHFDRYFACILCNERFLTRMHLDEHTQTVHNNKSDHKLGLKEFAYQRPSDPPAKGTEEGDEESTHKELRSKRVAIKSTKLGNKRSARLQNKEPSPNAKTATKKKSTRKVGEGTPLVERETIKVSPYENPYPTFDAFYRVKKITDHSIDNLRIASLTFNDVFDQAFFTRIKCNIRENLLNHIDGKLFKNEESESRISNFEKTTQVEVPSTDNNYGCELSLNAATPVANFPVPQQLGDDPESQIEYGSKASKKKTTVKQDEVHYKYFTRRKYQASILESKENRDLSKLDMWTQVVVKNRQQTVLNKSKTDKEIQEYMRGEEYKDKKLNKELNRILDRRGPFEDLKEEANKKAALEGNFNGEAYIEASAVLEDILQSVFSANNPAHPSTIETTKTELTDSEIPSFLNLHKASSLTNDSHVDRSDKITLICSSEETENFEAPQVPPRDKNALVELTGEWARSRIYICAACGLKLANMRSLIDHKNVVHQNVWCHHYEFVGNQGAFYKNLSIPGLGKMELIEMNSVCKTWQRSDARICSKCKKQCNSLGELHRHILECGEDWSWMLARKKCKYRPFGAKTRRKRRGLFKRIINKEKSNTENREKKIYKREGPRIKPSDAETIQRMLKNLPAKRATRKIMCLKDGFPTKKTASSGSKASTSSAKAAQQASSTSSNSADGSPLDASTSVHRKVSTANKCNPVTNVRKSVRNLNKVISSALIDNNVIVKRKVKILQENRSKRKTEEPLELPLIPEMTEEQKAKEVMKKMNLLKKVQNLRKSVIKKRTTVGEQLESGSNNGMQPSDKCVGSSAFVSAPKGKSCANIGSKLMRGLSLKRNNRSKVQPVVLDNSAHIQEEENLNQNSSAAKLNAADNITATNINGIGNSKVGVNKKPASKKRKSNSAFGTIKKTFKKLKVALKNPKISASDATTVATVSDKKDTEEEKLDQIIVSESKMPEKDCYEKNISSSSDHFLEESSLENPTRTISNSIENAKDFSDNCDKSQSVTSLPNPKSSGKSLSLAEGDILDLTKLPESASITTNQESLKEHNSEHPDLDILQNQQQKADYLQLPKVGQEPKLDQNQIPDQGHKLDHIHYIEHVDQLPKLDCEIKLGPETDQKSETSLIMANTPQKPKGKLSKRHKGLNDCIAMLTSKLKGSCNIENIERAANEVFKLEPIVTVTMIPPIIDKTLVTEEQNVVIPDETVNDSLESAKEPKECCIIEDKSIAKNKMTDLMIVPELKIHPDLVTPIESINSDRVIETIDLTKEVVKPTIDLSKEVVKPSVRIGDEKENIIEQKSPQKQMQTQHFSGVDMRLDKVEDILKCIEDMSGKEIRNGHLDNKINDFVNFKQGQKKIGSASKIKLGRSKNNRDKLNTAILVSEKMHVNNGKMKIGTRRNLPKRKSKVDPVAERRIQNSLEKIIKNNLSTISEEEEVRLESKNVFQHGPNSLDQDNLIIGQECKKIDEVSNSEEPPKLVDETLTIVKEIPELVKETPKTENEILKLEKKAPKLVNEAPKLANDTLKLITETKKLEEEILQKDTSNLENESSNLEVIKSLENEMEEIKKLETEKEKPANIFETRPIVVVTLQAETKLDASECRNISIHEFVASDSEDEIPLSKLALQISPVSKRIETDNMKLFKESPKAFSPNSEQTANIKKLESSDIKIDEYAGPKIKKKPGRKLKKINEETQNAQLLESTPAHIELGVVGLIKENQIVEESTPLTIKKRGRKKKIILAPEPPELNSCVDNIHKPVIPLKIDTPPKSETKTLNEKSISIYDFNEESNSLGDNSKENFIEKQFPSKKLKKTTDIKTSLEFKQTDFGSLITDNANDTESASTPLKDHKNIEDSFIKTPDLDNSVIEKQIVKNLKVKRGPKAKKEKDIAGDDFEEKYCDICNKHFVRADNLIKHKRTLTHIAKLSEIEALENQAKLKLSSVCTNSETAKASFVAETKPVDQINLAERTEELEKENETSAFDRLKNEEPKIDELKPAPDSNLIDLTTIEDIVEEVPIQQGLLKTQAHTEAPVIVTAQDPIENQEMLEQEPIKVCEPTFPNPLVKSPFGLNTNNDALKLVDIINDVLNKPVNEELDKKYSNELISTPPRTLESIEPKRYKSLGERKSFDSDSPKIFPTTTNGNFGSMHISPPHLVITNKNPDAYVKEQISLLENILVLQDQQNLEESQDNKEEYVDLVDQDNLKDQHLEDPKNLEDEDIPEDEEKSLDDYETGFDEENDDDRCPSDMSLVSDIKVDDSSRIISYSDRQDIKENFLKPNQYDEASENEDSLNNRAYDDRARKTLNRDEELFLECCSLLKSSSEVSNFSKKSFNVLSSNHYGNAKAFENENAKVFENGWTANKTNENSSNVNENSFMSNSLSQNSQCTRINNEFSDSESESDGIDWNCESRLSDDDEETLGGSFTNFSTPNHDFHDISSDIEGNNSNSQSFSKKFDAKFGGIVAEAMKCKPEKTIIADKKPHTNKTEYQTSITDYTTPLVKSPIDSTSNDSKKMPVTKGAMKVFEGLKVSIPTEDLDMHQVLNCSPTSKRLEITLKTQMNKVLKVNKEVKEREKISKVEKESRSDKELILEKVLKPNKELKVKKEIKINHELKIDKDSKFNNKSKGKPLIDIKFGNKLGLKVTKKPRSKSNHKKYIDDNLIHVNNPIIAPARVVQCKIPDVYDFEETQDNTDLFTSDKLKPLAKLNRKNKSFLDVDKDESSSSKLFLNSFSENQSSLSTTETESSISTVKNSVDNEAITKKKCKIMGRIFKNAFKSKVDNHDEIFENRETTLNEIPAPIIEEPLENVIINSEAPIDDSKADRPKMTEQEMDLLFDKLLEDAGQKSKKQKLNQLPQKEVSNHHRETAKNDNGSKTEHIHAIRSVVLSKRKKRARKHQNDTDSSDDDFNLDPKPAKKRTARKTKENGTINLDEELKECMGVAGRKSQRKCTSGKQNVLIEYWSSDDSEFEAMCRLSLQLSENDKINKETTIKTNDNQVIIPEKSERTNEKSERTVDKFDSPKFSKSTEQQNNSVSEEHKSSRSSIKRSRKSSKSSSNKTKNHIDDDEGALKTSDSPATIASNRRKRSAGDTLYYWSSSSDEDDAQNLIEIKNVRDDEYVLDDQEDRPAQHGWIVGDSPKKLVTMLAQAKGKKQGDGKCVKEQGKKRTTL